MHVAMYVCVCVCVPVDKESHFHLLLCPPGDESFIKAVQVLITWLDRGDCSKRNANCFYSMIQSTNSHVRRLLGEKSQYDEELNRAKELMRQRMQGLLMQCKSSSSLSSPFIQAFKCIT